MENFNENFILANIYILCLDQLTEKPEWKGKLYLRFLETINKNEKCKICEKDWYFLSNFNACWYELELSKGKLNKPWLFKMKNELNSEVNNDIFYDGKCYYPILVNSVYKDELYGLLQTIKKHSITDSIAMVFYIEQSVPGERVQGVLKLKEFVNALCVGELRFNTVYLIR